MALTHLKIKKLTKTGLHGDGFGLYLRIAPGGSKQWIQRVQYGGKRRDLGLGAWPVVPLSKARERAFANRVAISDGKDPLADRRKATAPTFREASAQTYEANKGRWKNSKTAANWTGQLELHAFPIFGDKPVDKIERTDVLRVLTPIWGRKLDVARKLRGRIRAVLAHAMSQGHVDVNVAGEMIDAALPAQPAVRAHYRFLPFDQVPDSLRAVEAATGASDAVRALFRFLVLTACRAGEARGARWSEIDLDAATWTIPADRMKANRAHRVPLSDAALTVLREVEPLRGESDLVFQSPARPGKPLSNMTLTKLLRSEKIDAVPHGYRTSFRTWASERTNSDHAVMELSLSHQVGDAVERAYARSDLFAKRRRLMDLWGAYLTSDSATVVSFPASGAN